MNKPFLYLRFLRNNIRNLNTSASSATPKVQYLSSAIPFFRGDNGFLLNRLCEEKKFEEAIEILCQQRRLKEAIEILHFLDQLNIRPSASIYATLLQFCLDHRALQESRRVHSHIKSSGFQPGIFLCNRLIDIFSKCESLIDARQVFDQMFERDACSWNTMIAGYAKNGDLENAHQLFAEMPGRDNFSWSTMIAGYARHGQPGKALHLFEKMQKTQQLKSNKFTISSALAASASVPSLRYGKEIHGHIMRTGMESDGVVWSSLSDMYAKCGSIKEARRVFDKMPERDVVSWTTMIGRYVQDGQRQEAFHLFSDMLKSNKKPNQFTFAGILSACSAQANEEMGKQVHAYMTRTGFDPTIFAASALVDMYAKCGNTVSARNVFAKIPSPDLIAWTSMIRCYAQNGLAEEALRYFDLLLQSGTKPDHITFVTVLSACTHAGLVGKGLELFHSIKEKHGLTHTQDHYACIIDLLGRAGMFEEAEKIINKMPIKPDKFLWASLLGACRIYGNLELGKRAADALFEIEPENPATYVTLANIYADAGLWDEVLKTRKLMDARGVVKKPGSSWIEVSRQVYVFLVGDRSHSRTDEIYRLLDKLSMRMKEEGYVPDTKFVLHDVEEEQKEQNLSHHSEKLAVAFGILATPAGKPIKVFKNLRICGDCHNAIKFISKIAEREISVRDSSRFHLFKNGACSCGDFW